MWVLASCAAAQGQVPPQAQETALSPRPLTAQEGEAIVHAARERDQQGGRKPDCSHLVHEVYTLAGFAYPYASSFDLYAGVEGFVRVAKAQPGDLVVWRGHVGIVVDPEEHSFYSSLRSGLRTEFYDAPPWRARGTARFYRYATAIPPRLVLTGNRPAKIPTEPALNHSRPAAEESHEDLPDSASSRANVSDSAGAAIPRPEVPSVRTSFEIPSRIVVGPANEMPSRSEIVSSISELNNVSGDLLRAQDLSQLGRTVIVYDDIALVQAKIKGSQGSAQMRIESRVKLAGERIEPMQRSETHHWNLVRANGGWEILAPKDSLVVPRDVAIRMLAARLAFLTQEEDVSGKDFLHEESQIVRVLSTLLN